MLSGWGEREVPGYGWQSFPERLQRQEAPLRRLFLWQDLIEAGEF